MRKNFILVCLLFLNLGFLFSQSPELHLSEEYELNQFGGSLPSLAGYGANSFFTYYLTTDEIRLQEFDNKGLNFKNESILKLPGQKQSEKRVIKVFNSSINHLMYFITTELNEKENYCKLSGFTVNEKGEQSELFLLEKMSVGKWNEHWKYGFQLSPNENYLAFYHDYSIGDTSLSFLEFNVINFKSQVSIKKGSIARNTDLMNFKLSNFMIDDSCHLFLSTVHRGRYVSQARYNLYFVSELEPNNVVKELVDVNPITGFFAYAVSFVLDKTNTIIGVGLNLDSADISLIRSYFCIRMNAFNFATISKSFKKISPDFDMAYFGVEGSSTLRIICTLPIRNITSFRDSSFFISSEVFYNGFETPENLSKEVFFYGDILSAYISPRGMIKSINVIPKYQAFYDGDQKLGTLMASTGFGIAYFYLDRNKNYKENKHIRNQALERTSSAVPVSAQVDRGGDLNYNVFDDFETIAVERPLIQQNMSITDDDKTKITVLKRRKVFQFMKIIY